MHSTGTEARVAGILNGFWMARHYARGARLKDKNSPLALKRAEAIHDLGLIVRAAFNESEDFEPLLKAVADGAKPFDEQTF